MFVFRREYLHITTNILTSIGPKDARDYAKERALAGPVATHHAQGGAGLNLQVHLPQGPELARPPLVGPAEGEQFGEPRGTAGGDPVLLAYSLEGDGRLHRWSANPDFTLTNSAKPTRNRARENREK